MSNFRNILSLATTLLGDKEKKDDVEQQSCLLFIRSGTLFAFRDAQCFCNDFPERSLCVAGCCVVGRLQKKQRLQKEEQHVKRTHEPAEPRRPARWPTGWRSAGPLDPAEILFRIFQGNGLGTLCRGHFAVQSRLAHRADVRDNKIRRDRRKVFTRKNIFNLPKVLDAHLASRYS
jgi:hypothetical protein